MFLRMRTTIRLDDDLFAQAKQYAADTGKTLSAVIEEALREFVARRRLPARRKPERLHTVGGSGKLPGVDLDASASLLESMES